MHSANTNRNPTKCQWKSSLANKNAGDLFLFIPCIFSVTQIFLQRTHVAFITKKKIPKDSCQDFNVVFSQTSALLPGYESDMTCIVCF